MSEITVGSASFSDFENETKNLGTRQYLSQLGARRNHGGAQFFLVESFSGAK